MRSGLPYFLIPFIVSEWLSSCTTLEKASLHGLTSGYYAMKQGDKDIRKVYLDVTEEKIDVYPMSGELPDKTQMTSVPLTRTDSLTPHQMTFKKQSLDIDITSILLKYRPAVLGLPAQLNTDLNVAVYAGWRFDTYHVKSRKDPLGRKQQKISTLGYDLGFFAGPGTAMISPSTTLNRRAEEYNGMVLQTGIAGFIESSMASFGLSIGYDHLMNPDRKIWIYRNKPWVGFIVGIALN